jgi:hypothetical protein
MLSFEDVDCHDEEKTFHVVFSVVVLLYQIMLFVAAFLCVCVGGGGKKRFRCESENAFS